MMSGQVQKGRLIKTLALMLVVSTMLVECTPTPTPTPATSGTVFTYQVQVQDQITGNVISGANVTITIGGDIAPVDDVTDVKGIAMIPIDASRAGKPGRLSVTAPGYEKYDKYVNLTEGTLPEMIPLVKSGASTSITPSLTPSTPTPSPTHIPPPTATPKVTPTASPIARTLSAPTSTSTRTPASTPRSTGSPQSEAPVLTAPSYGGTYKSPIEFKWSGSLNAGQIYQVTAYHVESGHVIQSGSLAAQTWTADLPGDKYGEWRWRVAVLGNGEVAATSAEWMFWFQPFGGGDNGGDGDATYTPPP